ncbi:DUF2807 domain-containing protein [Dehalococcoidia bacterium]|nr:DUF2807 domain-containing protein [Dehalococcoidia bacterium]
MRILKLKANTLVYGLVVVLLTGLTACASSTSETITGSGDLVTHEQAFSDFRRIQATHGFQLKLRRDPTFAVAITADKNVLEYVHVEKQGDRLVLGIREGLSVRNSTLLAEISMPELREIVLHEGCHALVTDFRSSDDLTVNLSGASRLAGDIGAGDLDFEISGASELELSGSGKSIKVEAIGGSQLDLKEFPADSARVDLREGSSAVLDIRKKLGPVHVRGGSNLIYHGDPSIKDLNTAPGSRIRPG